MRQLARACLANAPSGSEALGGLPQVVRRGGSSYAMPNYRGGVGAGRRDPPVRPDRPDGWEQPTPDVVIRSVLLGRVAKT